MVEQQWRAELSQQSGRLASQLAVRNAGLYMLIFGRWRRHRQDGLGTPKCRRVIGGLRSGGVAVLTGSDCTHNGRRSLQECTAFHRSSSWTDLDKEKKGRPRV